MPVPSGVNPKRFHKLRTWLMKHKGHTKGKAESMARAVLTKKMGEASVPRGEFGSAKRRRNIERLKRIGFKPGTRRAFAEGPPRKVSAAEAARMPRAVKLLGEGSPVALATLVQSSMDACVRNGGKDCEPQALVVARNAGWRRTPGGWEKAGPRALTFAEAVDPATFKAKTFFMRDVELVREGTWPVGEDENGQPVHMAFDGDTIEALARSTNEIHDRLKPMVTLGHVDDGAAAGQPGLDPRRNVAGGQVGPLKVVRLPDGTKSLRATAITSIPAALAVAIENRGVGERSIEADIGYVDPSSGKRYPIVLKRVALLGGTKPRIDNMDQLPQLYEEDAALDWVEDAAKSRVVIPAQYRREGFKIAAAEGGPPARLHITAAGDGGMEEIDVKPEELEALVTAAVSKAVPDALAKILDKAEEPEPEGEEPEEPEEPVEPGEPSDKVVKASADKAEVEKLIASVNQLMADNRSLTTKVEGLNASLASEAARGRSEADAVLLGECKKAGIIVPAEEKTLKVLLAEGDKLGKVKLGEGPEEGTVGDLVRQWLRTRRALNIRAVDLSEKAVKDEKGNVIASGEDADELSSRGMDPEKIAKAVGLALSGKAGFKLGPGVADFITG